MNATTRPSLWTLLTLAIALVLAANSFLSYRALTRQIAVSPSRTPNSRLAATGFSAVSYSTAVWTGDREGRSRPPILLPILLPKDELHSVRRGLLVNTTLALVLVFAVAAAGPRQRS
ncbi:MAG TPA: hypothetical protein VKR43_06495 [Bryobacteraceae bacterium]|nr:hypothetical protein [Bryobacteraceae bacterium]